MSEVADGVRIGQYLRRSKWARARVGQFLAINRAAPWNLVMIPRAAQIFPREESQFANVEVAFSSISSPTDRGVHLLPAPVAKRLTNRFADLSPHIRIAPLVPSVLAPLAACVS